MAHVTFDAQERSNRSKNAKGSYNSYYMTFRAPLGLQFSSVTLEIKRIEPREFDAQREEWNALLERSACDSVFLRWEWIHTWWKHFQQPHRTLVILTARLEGRLVGIAPFYFETAGLLRTRTLKFCSEELSPDYLDIIAEKGQEADFARSLWQYLQEHSEDWDLISLDNLRAESLLATDPASFNGNVHAVVVSNRCPHITIDRPFDIYYRERPVLASFSFHKKMRHLFDKMNVKHVIASDEKCLSRQLDDLFFLHEKRAQQMHMRSNFTSEMARRFHLEVSGLFFQEQILSLHFLYDGLKPVSAYYAFIYGRKEFLYQTGFDPAYSKWSAGAVLLYFCVRRAFEDGLREFDFLKGTESYKSLWANGFRDEMQLTGFNKTWRGSFWHTMSRLKGFLRRVKHIFIRRPSASRTSL